MNLQALSGLIKFRVKFASTQLRSDVEERLTCVDKLRHFISVRELNESLGERLSQDTLVSFFSFLYMLLDAASGYS